VAAVLVQCCGGLMALASLWPMAAAMQAVERRDYLSGVLYVSLVVVLARTGLDLACGGPAEPAP
jgi:hypothetical protein